MWLNAGVVVEWHVHTPRSLPDQCMCICCLSVKVQVAFLWPVMGGATTVLYQMHLGNSLKPKILDPPLQRF